MNIIELQISRKSEIELGINSERPQITLDINTSGGAKRETYAGPYEVIPKFMEQILGTNEKIMQDDVTVHQIPVQRVGNLSGGYTVTIGG